MRAKWAGPQGKPPSKAKAPDLPFEEGLTHAQGPLCDGSRQSPWSHPLPLARQGTRLAEELRGKGCDFIIALTHMRVPNDLLLAENVRGVDLILGGHDHDYSVRRHGPGGVWVVKSGTDFREATELTIHFGAEAEERLAADPECGAAERTGGFHVAPRRVEVTKAYPEDAEVRGGGGRGGRGWRVGVWGEGVAPPLPRAWPAIAGDWRTAVGEGRTVTGPVTATVTGPLPSVAGRRCLTINLRRFCCIVLVLFFARATHLHCTHLHHESDD